MLSRAVFVVLVPGTYVAVNFGFRVPRTFIASVLTAAWLLRNFVYLWLFGIWDIVFGSLGYASARVTPIEGESVSGWG